MPPEPAIEQSAAILDDPIEVGQQVVASAVYEALARGDLRAFTELASMFRAVLGPKARWGLAWAALLACDDQEARDVVETVFFTDESLEGK